VSSEVGSDASGMLPVTRGPESPHRREHPERFDLNEIFDGGCDRDRTCDPYHVKEVRGPKIADLYGICGMKNGNNSRDVPLMFAFSGSANLRALPKIWGFPRADGAARYLTKTWGISTSPSLHVDATTQAKIVHSEIGATVAVPPVEGDAV
jgi:hypothetical protein